MLFNLSKKKKHENRQQTLFGERNDEKITGKNQETDNKTDCPKSESKGYSTRPLLKMPKKST
jgi:hypothetical protein